MSVMTIFQSACLKFGVAPDHQRFSDDFYSALNNAQNDFAISRSWGFLRTTANLTTVASTRTVALPADFGKIYDFPKSLIITSPAANAGTRIELMPFEQWQADEWDDGTDTDTPAFAYILGSLLYLSPIPDAAYTINMAYYKTPTTIANTSTALTVPALYEEALQKMVWRRLQDAGYSSVQELSISDADINRLMNSAARDDIRKYGGVTFNLSSSDYTRKTI